jgi:hypothetical protein
MAGKARKAGLSIDSLRDREGLQYHGTQRFQHDANRVGDQERVPRQADRNARKGLSLNGGCLGGPIGFTQSIAAISSGAIDIGHNSDKYAGFIKVQAESGTADDLTDINNPMIYGEEIRLQADTGDTITIKTSGNIDTFDGSDFTLNGDKVTLFIWDGSKWRQESGGGGSSASFPLTPTIDDRSDTWTGTQDIDLSQSDAHVTKFTLDQNLTLTFGS